MPFENDSIPTPTEKHVLLLQVSDSLYNKPANEVSFPTGSLLDHALSTPVPEQVNSPYVVSAEQMFGSKSTLLCKYHKSYPVGTPINRKYPLDTPWSFALLLALPLLALLLIRYTRSYLKQIPLLLVSIKAAQKEYESREPSQTRTLSVLSWFSLVTAAILIVYLLRKFPSIYGEYVRFSASPIVIAGLLGYVMLKNIILYVASVLTFSKNFVRELIYNGNLFAGAWGFASFFFILLLFIYDGKQLDILFYIISALCIIFIILYLVRSLQLFLFEKISPFFWILYLCTLEIAPVLLVIDYLYPTK